MNTLFQDLRYAIRLMIKSPGFVTAAVIALALGIGSNTAIFSVVNGVMLRPLPYEAPDRLMVISETNPQQGEEDFNVSYPNFMDFKQQSNSFEQMSAMRFATLTLTGGEEAERIPTALVSSDLFSLLRVKPSLGRTFLAEEDRPGGDQVVIISHSLWQRRFGSDPEIISKPLTLNGETYTVIGVMPAGFEFPSEEIGMWLALGPLADTTPMKNRAVHFLNVIARLNPGVTRQQALTELETIAGRIQQQHAEADPGHGVGITSLHAEMVGDVRPALLVLLGAVAFVLLIACANVANLLLARAWARQKEIAIRAALGAGRGRIVRQLLTESALLAVTGGAIGLLLALWGVDLLVNNLPDYVPRAKEIAIDRKVLGFTLSLSLLTGLVFGIVPTLRLSKTGLSESLKEGGRKSGGGFGRNRARSVLVISEVALSLVLLIGAGLMIKSFWRLAQVDPGFRPENLLTMTVSLPDVNYPETEQVISFYQQLPQRLEALPGVKSVSAVNSLPISGGDSHGQLTIDGRPFPPGEAPAASYRRVLPNYFRAIGIPLLRGREFDERDKGDDPKVVIINEEMARRYWKDSDPVGSRIKVGPAENEPWLTVVGVVGDVRNVGLEAGPSLATYEPHPQRPWSTMNVIVRTEGDPVNLAAAVRDGIRAIDRQLPISNISTMDQRISRSVAPQRFNMFLLGVFAALALMLAGVGIYGVMSYSVTQRTSEIGVRMALGARPGDVLRLVVGQGMMLTLTGVAIGLVAAFALTRVMGSLLFGVSATDILTFFIVSVLLTGVSLAACYLPARRAAKVDPMTALRYE